MENTPEMQAIKETIEAWESLEQGNHPPKVIAEWLAKEMKTAIDNLRKLIKK